MSNIGAHVHYKAHGSLDGTYPPVCRAAILAQPPTLQDGTGPTVVPAAVVVFNPTGMFFHGALPQDEDEQRGGTWHTAHTCKGTGLTEALITGGDS